MTDTQLEARAAGSVGDELARAHDKIANLETALKSSRRIGMAMRILMAQFKIREDEAFDLLREASQAQNRKLRDLADDVVLVGTLEPNGFEPG